MRITRRYLRREVRELADDSTVKHEMKLIVSSSMNFDVNRLIS